MQTFLILAFLILTSQSLLGAEIEENQQENFKKILRDKIGFSAEIPISVCKRLFPFSKSINKVLVNDNVQTSFTLFAFTTKPFDPKKPSILYIHGGPGGIWSPEDANENSEIFPDSNVVFFHYRGGGCSSFKGSDESLDRFISTQGTLQDIENIRESYGISVWKAVVGFSYGTDISRRYAHHFSNRVQNLVLEGLNSSEDLSPEDEAARMLESISKRYKISEKLKAALPATHFISFLEFLKSYLSKIPTETNLALAAAWDDYKKPYELAFQDAGQKLPEYFNRDTFLSIVILMYTGEEDSSDYAILMLMNNFGFLQLPADSLKSLQSAFKQHDNFFFPYLNPNYLDSISTSPLLSWRVLLSMPENDKAETSESLCSSVKTIVINGSQDLATPVENVHAFLSNKKCASALSNRALVVQGGGHSSLGSLKCLNTYVRHALNKTNTDNDLKSCEVPIQEKIY